VKIAMADERPVKVFMALNTVKKLGESKYFEINLSPRQFEGLLIIQNILSNVK